MGLTLQQLSDRLALQGIEIGRAGISRWECGDRQPNASQFLGVCRVLGIENIGAFFGLEPPQPELNELGMKKLKEYKEDLIASGRYAPQRKGENIRYISIPVSMLPASAEGDDVHALISHSESGKSADAPACTRYERPSVS